MKFVSSIVSLLPCLGDYLARRAHIDFLKDRLHLLTNENESLKAENASLVEKVAQYQSKMEASAETKDLVERRGAYFKRVSGNHYESVPICLNCYRRMSLGKGGFLFEGTFFECVCGYRPGLTRKDIADIIQLLSVEGDGVSRPHSGSV